MISSIPGASYGGRAAIRQLIKQDPATYLRIMINVVAKLHKPSD